MALSRRRGPARGRRHLKNKLLAIVVCDQARMLGRSSRPEYLDRPGHALQLHWPQALEANSVRGA
jgi:hypothetical protein